MRRRPGKKGVERGVLRRIVPQTGKAGHGSTLMTARARRFVEATEERRGRLDGARPGELEVREVRLLEQRSKRTIGRARESTRRNRDRTLRKKALRQAQGS